MQPWIYIVLVGAVAIVYGMILPARRKEEGAEKQSLKDTEAALGLYMADLERENEEMLQLVSSIKQQSQSTKAALQEEIAVLREQVAGLEKTTMLLDARLTAEEKGLIQLTAFTKDNAARQPADDASGGAESAPAPKPKPVSSIKLRYPRLFELHEQGKSIDSIAKTAGLQRGEVQLILQLAKQEESV